MRGSEGGRGHGSFSTFSSQRSIVTEGPVPVQCPGAGWEASSCLGVPTSYGRSSRGRARGRSWGGAGWGSSLKVAQKHPPCDYASSCISGKMCLFYSLLIFRDCCKLFFSFVLSKLSKTLTYNDVEFYLCPWKTVTVKGTSPHPHTSVFWKNSFLKNHSSSCDLAKSH